MAKMLITGANGQIGSELISLLREKHGKENVVGLDLRPPAEAIADGPFEIMDATNKEKLEALVKKEEISQIFHLVGILSATGEKNPNLAYNVNMNSLKHVLDIAKEQKIKVFWPSSIAAFGPTTPRDNTPQRTVLEPNTMYGVTKVAGELLCNYYFHKFGVDVRSMRYPGLLSWKTPPGGGTTDYAVAIFYDAITKGKYDCFVREDTILPMMYMPDAIRAIMELMDADASKLSVRTSYNITALSFSAKELADDIKKRKMPAFECTYSPDERQKIADSWPNSIDDSAARNDWGWKHEYSLEKIVDDMFFNLEKKLK
ncbi:NAD-dependent epimerase [Candidatus Micrarchaeota archaeon CG10_big_fil_rev_8_21_14_0_10_45_29]|nr:MAG: NAD-dependent epimerase [Candidatus Micrarchaeota archaeon CG10_big_fil_rev_8_21_14_0_10_45_29]